MRILVNATTLDNTFRVGFVAGLEEKCCLLDLLICFDGSFWQCNKMLRIVSGGILLFHIGEDQARPTWQGKALGTNSKKKMNTCNINTVKHNTHLTIQAIVEQGVKAHTKGDREQKLKQNDSWH